MIFKMIFWTKYQSKWAYITLKLNRIAKKMAGVKHNNIPEPDSEMKQVQNSSACLHKWE